MKKVYIGSDHAGFEVKKHVKRILKDLKIPFEDLGTDDDAPCDYPIIAQKLGKKVVKDKTKGILICGSGTGVSIAANKVPGVRAALGYDEFSSRMSRFDNNANVLALRARDFPKKRYRPIIRTWFKTPFSGFVRHKRRNALLAQLDKGQLIQGR